MELWSMQLLAPKSFNIGLLGNLYRMKLHLPLVSSSQNNIFNQFQECIQNPVKYLKCSVLQRKWTAKTINHFRKTLRLRCLAGFWIPLCIWLVTTLNVMLNMNGISWVFILGKVFQIFFYYLLVFIFSHLHQMQLKINMGKPQFTDFWITSKPWYQCNCEKITY